ncbi:VWA domain-containing protein [Robiginitalea sp. SC105]|uniref:vWA domain-containing protein n=1 Tax=Robiginitalea sp. SC105 TaxID=2762332 RepID=UPI00163AA0E0|nr:vWA domain-containing protein [Robiginitalea sp. SC105]MBC2838808.1 VWA domain-containing protein [Robiginitalea sp. SC105]
MEVKKKIRLMALVLMALPFAGMGGTPPLQDAGVKTTPVKTRPRVQIALLLDTSNSMDGLINQAKATLWDLVNEFSYVRCRERQVPDLEIALYEYGNDGLSAGEGFIRQVLPFSRDLDEISQRLFSLSTNGGEEFCGQVIQSAMRQLQWSSNSGDLKFIFIAGNEPFNQGRIPYESVLENAAEQDVVVNTIFCGDYQLGVRTLWADGARRGRGDYTAIDHNRAIVHVKTPYDEVIIRLNQQLNKTYIGYGRMGASRKQQQAAQDANAAEMEEAVMVDRAVSKSSAFYSNESWDLVDAHARGKLDLAELDREGLPGNLQQMETGELKAYLEARRQERKAIQEDIQKANAKRAAYLSENRPEAESGLQAALLKAVRKQAERKAFTWVQ